MPLHFVINFFVSVQLCSHFFHLPTDLQKPLVDKTSYYGRKDNEVTGVAMQVASLIHSSYSLRSAYSLRQFYFSFYSF